MNLTTFRALTRAPRGSSDMSTNFDQQDDLESPLSRVDLYQELPA